MVGAGEYRQVLTITDCEEGRDAAHTTIARGICIVVDIALVPDGVRAFSYEGGNVDALACSAPAGGEIDDYKGATWLA